METINNLNKDIDKVKNIKDEPIKISSVNKESLIEGTMNEIAILVISCDNYSDCWMPFFTFFKRFWPNCRFKIYLGTNSKNYNFEGLDINVIKIGEDKSWTGNVKQMVSQISEKYIITFLEDFFLCKYVDEKKIDQAIEDFILFHLSGLRLLHHPKGTKKLNKTLLEIQPQDEYCIATHIELWDKNIYLEYLVDGYTAWEFEILNSRKCNEENKMLGRFASVKTPIFHWKNGVIQRKWVRSALRFCRKEKVIINSKRETMSRSACVKEFWRGKLRSVLPKHLRIAIKNVLLKTRYKDSFVDKEIKNIK